MNGIGLVMEEVGTVIGLAFGPNGVLILSDGALLQAR